MDCPECENEMISAIYLCNDTNYVVEKDGVILQIMPHSPHKIPDGNDEIGSSVDGFFCKDCVIFREVIS